MGPDLMTLPLWMVIALPFAKILSTSLSIGSGGSGGIFGPGMVIGGMLGATFWRLGHDVLPNMPQSPAPFVIVGMMALFGGVAHAPLAVMLMVAEMTGNLSLLAPAMVAVAVSTALVGNTTIYRSQLPDRASSPVHRTRFSVPLLATLYVREAMTPPREPGRISQTVVEAQSLLAEQGAVVLAVVDQNDRFVRVVTRDGLGSVRDESAPLVNLPPSELEPLTPEMTLEAALEHLADYGLPWLPVVADQRIIGGMGARDALHEYHAAATRAHTPSTNAAV
jgi:CIC family chloride channel protein